MAKKALVALVLLGLAACSASQGARPASGLYVGGSSGVSQPSNENVRIR